MRVVKSELRVENENKTRVFLESLDFEIKMRVSQKSAIGSRRSAMGVWLGPIGLKAKDWGGMGISVQGGIKVTGGLTANF